MKRFLPILLILAMLLCGCNGAEEAPATSTAAPTTEASTAATTEPATQPTTEPVTDPTEPAVVYRNPLNGAVLDEPWNSRPVTFTIGNTDEALPQHSIAQADILCEITVEGGATRCMPIFSDLSNVGKIGSIRSARTYFISISRAFDAVFIHSGASPFATNLFQQTVVNHLDADPAIFYRDADRAAQGYAYEHRHFVVGSDANEYIHEKFDMTAKNNDGFGLNFVDEQTLDGENAGTVRVYFGNKYGKSTKFVYDEAAGNYVTTRFIANARETDWVDGETDEALRFENLIVMFEKRTAAPGATAGNVLHELVGSGEGYYACGGKIVPIKWSREREDSPFSFTLTDGTPLNVIPGKTYMGFLPLESLVEFE